MKERLEAQGAEEISPRQAARDYVSLLIETGRKELVKQLKVSGTQNGIIPVASFQRGDTGRFPIEIAGRVIEVIGSMRQHGRLVPGALRSVTQREDDVLTAAKKPLFSVSYSKVPGAKHGSPEFMLHIGRVEEMPEDPEDSALLARLNRFNNSHRKDGTHVEWNMGQQNDPYIHARFPSRAALAKMNLVELPGTDLVSIQDIIAGLHARISLRKFEKTIAVSKEPYNGTIVGLPPDANLLLAG